MVVWFLWTLDLRFPSLLISLVCVLMVVSVLRRNCHKMIGYKMKRRQFCCYFCAIFGRDLISSLVSYRKGGSYLMLSVCQPRFFSRSVPNPQPCYTWRRLDTPVFSIWAPRKWLKPKQTALFSVSTLQGTWCSSSSFSPCGTELWICSPSSLPVNPF